MKTTATSTSISTYNSFVQARAAAKPHLAGFSSEFRAVGSTAATDARDNTATTGTGVPIYWLGGAKVADDYADFYDGSWDSGAFRNESGNTFTFASASTGVWTGSRRDGTEFVESGTSFALGTSTPIIAYPHSLTAEYVLSALTVASSQSHHLYALSPVITVRASTTTVTPPDPPPPPEPVVEHDNLNVSIEPESDRLHLEWNAVKGANSYPVEWGESEDYSGGEVSIPRDYFQGTSYTITSLEPDTLYYVRVSATGDSGHITTQSLSKRTDPVERDPGPVVRTPGGGGGTPPQQPSGGGGAPQPQQPGGTSPSQSSPTEPGDTAPQQCQETRFDCTEARDLKERECDALVALYDATCGAGWNWTGLDPQKTKWFATPPVAARWQGITIEEMSVRELVLSGRNLRGELPQELADLEGLEVLDLSSNQRLTGDLPRERPERLLRVDVRGTGISRPDWAHRIDDFRPGPRITTRIIETSGGGCAVASGKDEGAGSALLGLLLVAFVLLAACPGRRS